MLTLKENEVLRKAADAIMAYASDLKRGETLLYTKMHEIGGIDRDDKTFGSLRQKLKKRFVDERGIVLKAAPGLGYMLLQTTEQQTTHVQDRFRKGRRQASRAITEVESIRQSELTLPGKILGAMAAQSAKRLRLAAFRSMADVTRQVHESNPRRPIPA